MPPARIARPLESSSAPGCPLPPTESLREYREDCEPATLYPRLEAGESGRGLSCESSLCREREKRPFPDDCLVDFASCDTEGMALPDLLFQPGQGMALGGGVERFPHATSVWRRGVSGRYATGNDV